MLYRKLRLDRETTLALFLRSSGNEANGGFYVALREIEVKLLGSFLPDREPQDAPSAHYNLSSCSNEQSRRSKVRQILQNFTFERPDTSASELRCLKRLGIIGKRAHKGSLIPLTQVPEVLQSFGLVVLASIVRSCATDLLNFEKAVRTGASVELLPNVDSHAHADNTGFYRTSAATATLKTDEERAKAEEQFQASVSALEALPSLVASLVAQHPGLADQLGHIPQAKPRAPGPSAPGVPAPESLAVTVAGYQLYVIDRVERAHASLQARRSRLWERPVQGGSINGGRGAAVQGNYYGLADYASDSDSEDHSTTNNTTDTPASDAPSAPLPDSQSGLPALPPVGTLLSALQLTLPSLPSLSAQCVRQADEATSPADEDTSENNNGYASHGHAHGHGHGQGYGQQEYAPTQRRKAVHDHYEGNAHRYDSYPAHTQAQIAAHAHTHAAHGHGQSQHSSHAHTHAHTHGHSHSHSMTSASNMGMGMGMGMGMSSSTPLSKPSGLRMPQSQPQALGMSLPSLSVAVPTHARLARQLASQQQQHPHPHPGSHAAHAGFGHQYAQLGSPGLHMPSSAYSHTPASAYTHHAHGHTHTPGGGIDHHRDPQSAPKRARLGSDADERDRDRERTLPTLGLSINTPYGGGNPRGLGMNSSYEAGSLGYSHAYYANTPAGTTGAGPTPGMTSGPATSSLLNPYYSSSYGYSGNTPTPTPGATLAATATAARLAMPYASLAATPFPGIGGYATTPTPGDGRLGDGKLFSDGPSGSPARDYSMPFSPFNSSE